jgi:tRNA A-37 threonylcarbamoyl transferase component Bud32
MEHYFYKLDGGKRVVVKKTLRKVSVDKKKGIVIKRGLGPKEFENEMRVYAEQLPYTPRLLDYDEGKRTITIEYIKGKQLKDIGLHNLTKEMLCELCEIIEDFKKQIGAWHGDLTSHNIIFRETDNKPILIDFGFLQNDYEQYMKHRGKSIHKKCEKMCKKFR